MQVTFRCPRCQNQTRLDSAESAESLRCAQCDWTREIGPDDVDGGRPTRCLACGCSDLWRQKDFPQKLGLLFVGLGIVLSTIAWAYHRPVVALGTLMAFALCDLLLYVAMRDVLVCYRCGARFRQALPPQDHPSFNLETAERYRQEARRLDQAARTRP